MLGSQKRANAPRCYVAVSMLGVDTNVIWQGLWLVGC